MLAFHVDQPRKADGDRPPESFRTLRVAVIRRSALHHDTACTTTSGETTRFTYRPSHEWYWIPQQRPTEMSSQVLRLGHRWLGLALVVSFGVHRPHGPRRRAVPQERRRQVARVLLVACNVEIESRLCYQAQMP